MCPPRKEGLSKGEDKPTRCNAEQRVALSLLPSAGSDLARGLPAYGRGINPEGAIYDIFLRKFLQIATVRAHGVGRELKEGTRSSEMGK